MNFFKRIYIGYAFVVFTILFFLLLPFFLVPIIFKSKYQMTGEINRIWARMFFKLTFFSYQLEYRFKPKKDQQYIFCPNHFSYLDIATMALNKVNTIFVGKNDMERVPIFGFMYKKLHITVDRKSLRSKYSTYIGSLQAIDNGKSLTIFPEGGMVSQEIPIMARFKDGAFRAAIEKQIPIVPVTIPFNWIILPGDSFMVNKRLLKAVYHEPIETKGMSLDDLVTLKQKTFDIIDLELKSQLNEN